MLLFKNATKNYKCSYQTDKAIYNVLNICAMCVCILGMLLELFNQITNRTAPDNKVN